MSQSPSPVSQTTKPIKSGEIVLLMTLIDTLWRTFVPTLSGLFIGFGIDKIFSTKPLYMFLLLGLGIGLSVLLVALQLKKVRSTL